MTLARETRLSECVRLAQADADVQTLGASYTRAADDLARRTSASSQAALQLGYLIGAARRGARHTTGIHVELVRRLEQTPGVDGPPARPPRRVRPRPRRRRAARMKLRLYHHPDGARVAYREVGTGPPLGLLHSAGLSHREWEPLVDQLARTASASCCPTCRCTGTPRTARAIPTRPTGWPTWWPASAAPRWGPRPLVGGHARRRRAAGARRRLPAT